MGTPCILAVDQGTSSTKALLVDAGGRQVSRGQCNVSIGFPRSGWVEQDPVEIWNSVVAAASNCLESASASGVDVVGIGICNQRESAVAWSRRSGAPLGPCVTWQCRRTSEFCDRLRSDRDLTSWIEATTGLTIDPLFSASKFRWLLDAIPDGRERAVAGEICIGTVDSWLVWNLTNRAVHATDASNASRTQLYDIVSGQWSPRLLEVFGIPPGALPEVRSSDASYGHAVHPDWPCRAPILAVAGDSHAAMFGHGAVAPGAVKATMGTGSSLMTLMPSAMAEARTGLSATVAWKLGDRHSHAIEGNIASAGATLDWIGRLFGHTDDPGAAAVRIAATAGDSGGVVFVPAFAGLGAPHWDDRSRALICGLTRGVGPPQMARAALESIAHQVADVFEAMQVAVRRPLAELRVDGGVSKNDVLLQFQADLLGRPVVRDNSLELSALGIAYIAGLHGQLWDIGGLQDMPRSLDRFHPSMEPAEASRQRDAWKLAIGRARLHSNDVRGRS